MSSPCNKSEKIFSTPNKHEGLEANFDISSNSVKTSPSRIVSAKNREEKGQLLPVLLLLFIIYLFFEKKRWQFYF